MIKVLAAALVGTIAGIVVMVVVIAISGTDTSGASSEGLGSLPLSTYSSSATSAPQHLDAERQHRRFDRRFDGRRW